MKRLIFTALAMLMLASCGGAGEKSPLGQEEGLFGVEGQTEITPVLSEEECDFGNLQWGMEVAEVQEEHGSAYTKPTPHTLRYERVRVEGFPSDAEYVFTDNKLSGAEYFIMPDREYEDKMQYLIDYKNLKAIYDERFGEPVEEELQFATDDETDDEEEQAELLYEKQLLFRTVWQSETTEVRMVMANRPDIEGICIGVKFTPVSNTQTEGTSGNGK